MPNIIATSFCHVYEKIGFRFQIDRHGKVTIRVYDHELLIRDLIAIIPAKQLDSAINKIIRYQDVELKRLKNDWRSGPRLTTHHGGPIRFLEPWEKPEDPWYEMAFSERKPIFHEDYCSPFNYYYRKFHIRRGKLIGQLRWLMAKHQAYRQEKK